MGLDIQAIAIAIVALIGSGGGITAIVAGFFKKFKEVGKEIATMAEAKELKNSLAEAHRENVELKKAIVAMIEKLDKMHYTDDEFIDSQVNDVLLGAGIDVSDFYPENLETNKTDTEQ